MSQWSIFISFKGFGFVRTAIVFCIEKEKLPFKDFEDLNNRYKYNQKAVFCTGIPECGVW